jgi:hypothetical protein
VTTPRRLVDVAREAGVEVVWLRGFLLLEVDRLTRLRARDRARQLGECDRTLFKSDPGYVGDVPLTQSASHRRSLTQSAARRSG